MIAIGEAWKAGLLGRKHWLRNLVSGVIVGIVALPWPWRLPLPLASSLSKASTPQSLAACWFRSLGEPLTDCRANRCVHRDSGGRHGQAWG